MKTKIQIKSIFGKLIFEFEKEDNSLKKTLTEAVNKGANLWGANLQGAYLQDVNLRDVNLRDANLWGANLQGANLQGANLWGANLQGAYLQGANLRDVNLQGANLQDVNLQSANLQGANLQGANLQGANLQGAYLQGANLRDVNLQGANLQDVNLQGADLQGADLKKLITQTTILPEGKLIVWKKLKDNLLAKLLIPVKAKRVNAIGYRKCRFEFAKVIAIYDGKKKVKEGISKTPYDLIYKVGAIVTPDSFDPSPLIECSHGINAFITKQEAINY